MTPYGNLNYSYSQPGSGQGQTTAGGAYIPQTTVTQTLSPGEQKLYDQTNQISTALNDQAIKGIGYVDQATAAPLNASQFGNLQTSAGVGTNYSTNAGSQSYNNGSGIGTSNFQSAPGAADYQAGPHTSNFQTAPNPTPYTNLSNTSNFQSNVGVGNDLTTSANYGQIQNGLDYSGVAAAPTADQFQSQRDQVTDSLMQRMQPYIDRDQSALDAKLANQGINLGSQAYGLQNGVFQQGVNDQRLAAVMAGSTEQQRNFNNALALRQQGVGEVNTQGGFANAAQAQGFGQAQTNANLNNSAQGQLFNQGLANANLGNSAASALYSQQANNTNIANQNQQNLFNQQMAGTNLNNQNAQNLFNQQSQNVATANTNATNNYNQNFANTGMNNTNAQALFAQQQANAGLQNQAATASQSDAMGNANLNNAAQSQMFNQGLANANLNNTAIGQQISQADYFKNQPLNMLNALRSGNQVTNPNFVNNTNTNIAAAPVYQATADQATAAQAAYAQQMAGYSSMLSGLGGLGSAAITKSDRRLKTKIEQIGTRAGLPLYFFSYLWSPERKEIGFMADEVEKKFPAAVSYDNGFAQVDYRMVR